MGLRTPGQSLAGVFVQKSLQAWRPSRVTLVGIAGSLDPDRVRLGDVVVPPDIFGYEVEDVEDGGTRLRPTFNQIGALDLDRVRAFRSDPDRYREWQEECRAAVPEGIRDQLQRPPELFLEPIASGNKVVKSVEFGKRLRAKVNAGIIGVEMEARGLFQALYLEGGRHDALMIRGISDYADANKTALERGTKDAWRAFAAANAARLQLALWRTRPVPPLSPGYHLDLTLGPRSRLRQQGVIDIEFRHVGAQDIVFPHLIGRSYPTPELFVEVDAITAAGTPPDGRRGLCVIESPERRVVEGKTTPTGMFFELPGSEWGLKVELLLSFSGACQKLVVRCQDAFKRITTAEMTMM